MWQSVKMFVDFLRLTVKGEYMGDAVILKSQFARFDPTDSIKDFVESVKGTTPDFSGIDFARMPEGSFGHEYFKFMTKEKLKPFKFSGQYRELMSENYLPVYYATVHDFFHVLTGYNTSLAGEAGVWGFVAGQDVSPQAERAVRLAKTYVPLIFWGKGRKIRLAADEGFLLGRKAMPVIKMDFKSQFNRPLELVRKEFKVELTAMKDLRYE